MARNWVPAGGEHQVPFLREASRAARGELGTCPKCGSELRSYFHVFQAAKKQGSLWLWCGACNTYVTLPRVQATFKAKDPFEALSTAQFAALETSDEEPFLDRLERLWAEGAMRDR